jgi:hypothetical protein
MLGLFMYASDEKYHVQSCSSRFEKQENGIKNYFWFNIRKGYYVEGFLQGISERSVMMMFFRLQSLR